MDMNSLRWLFFLSPLLILHLVAPTIAQLPNFLYYFCIDSAGNYTNNSTYQGNLNTLFSTLSSVKEIDYGFYNFSTGQEPNKVNAIALCRGDVRPDACRSCINDSRVKLTELCPYQKEAIGWYDYCMLRYSNRSIFGTAEASPAFYMWNLNNVSDVDVFNQALGKLLDRLQTKAAAGDSLRKFATGEESFTNFAKVYALVQCTPDLDYLSCSSCIAGAISEIPICCHNKQGGRVIRPSCNLRYEINPFYELTAENSPPPAAQPTSAPAILPPPPPTNTTSTKGKKSKTSLIVILIVVPSVFISVILLFGFICFFLKRKRNEKQVEAREDEDEIRTINSLQFDFGIIRIATNNFSDANKLGQGGFGSVYKGRLSDGQEIAVKRLSRGSGQGDVEFKNEVLLVAKLQHRNLVRLLGFCLEGSERLLIYEFLPNTSLDGFLFDPIKREILDWERRYKIIQGVARGLLYLHEDSQLRIIHHDLKASNILLDAKMNPKISDFGMARLLAVDDQTQGCTSNIGGTYGYMAPEYAMYGQFSVKSDVYSFGVLVLEILSAQKNANFCVSEDIQDLVSYAWKNWKEGTVTNLIDPTLETASPSEIMRCVHIGLLCVQANVADRPSMASVVLMLNSYSVSLPVPAEPGIFIHSSTGQEMPSGLEHDSMGTVSKQTISTPKHVTVDEDPITEVYPR